METITQDQHVFEYQQTGNSEELVQQFHNFISKYYTLLTSDTVDFRSYDVRCFLSCFIKSKYTRKQLIRGGRYLSKETVIIAKKVLDYLRFKLRNHNAHELYAELVIPFLQCANNYQDLGIGFQRYLYKSYMFALKRHLDDLKLDAIDIEGVMYYNQFENELDLGNDEPEEEFKIDLEEDLKLMDPSWIKGQICSELFKELRAHERYILAKYYYEEKTDKEIARMLPYNPKSIHRIRMRMKNHFMSLYQQGELKWIRL